MYYRVSSRNFGVCAYDACTSVTMNYLLILGMLCSGTTFLYYMLYLLHSK